MIRNILIATHMLLKACLVVINISCILNLELTRTEMSKYIFLKVTKDSFCQILPYLVVFLPIFEILILLQCLRFMDLQGQKQMQKNWEKIKRQIIYLGH